MFELPIRVSNILERGNEILEDPAPVRGDAEFFSHGEDDDDVVAVSGLTLCRQRLVAEVILDTGDQLLRLAWLEDVVIGTGRKPLDDVQRSVQRREENDWRIVSAGFGLIFRQSS